MQIGTYAAYLVHPFWPWVPGYPAFWKISQIHREISKACFFRIFFIVLESQAKGGISHTRYCTGRWKEVWELGALKSLFLHFFYISLQFGFVSENWENSPSESGFFSWIRSHWVYRKLKWSFKKYINTLNFVFGHFTIGCSCSENDFF
jgi:hypothetical protein